MNEPSPGGDVALEPGPLRARAWLAPGLLLAALVVVLGVVVLFAGRSGGSGAPPPPGAFVAPENPRAVAVFDVQQVGGGDIIFAGAPDLTIPATTVVERLAPIEPSAVEEGELIAILGEPNAVRNFALTAVIVYGEGAALAEDEGIIRSAGGFEGWEVSRNEDARTVVVGTVAAIDGERLVIDTAAGPMTMTLLEGADLNRYPFFRIEESSVDTISAGERVAFPAEGGAPVDDPEAVLVGSG